jgi:hypothetical protein
MTFTLVLLYNIMLFSIAQIFISTRITSGFILVGAFAILTTIGLCLKIDKGKKQAYLSLSVSFVAWALFTALLW